MVVMGPPPEPIVETYYLAPIYTGIIVMNPPEKHPPKPKHPPPPQLAAQPAAPDTPHVSHQDSDQSVPLSGESGKRSR